MKVLPRARQYRDYFPNTSQFEMHKRNVDRLMHLIEARKIELPYDEMIVDFKIHKWYEEADTSAQIIGYQNKLFDVAKSKW